MGGNGVGRMVGWTRLRTNWCELGPGARTRGKQVSMEAPAAELTVHRGEDRPITTSPPPYYETCQFVGWLIGSRNWVCTPSSEAGPSLLTSQCCRLSRPFEHPSFQRPPPPGVPVHHRYKVWGRSFSRQLRSRGSSDRPHPCARHTSHAGCTFHCPCPACMQYSPRGPQYHLLFTLYSPSPEPYTPRNSFMPSAEAPEQRLRAAFEPPAPEQGPCYHQPGRAVIPSLPSTQEK